MVHRWRTWAARAACAGWVGIGAACFTYGTSRGYETADRPPFQGAVPPGFRGRTVALELGSGVLLLVHAGRSDVYPTEGEQVLLELRLLVPEGIAVQLVEPVIVLESAGWATNQEVKVACLEAWTGERLTQFTTDDVVYGGAETLSWPGISLSLVDSGPRMQTRVPAVDEFLLRLPDMRVDGCLVTLAPLRFKAWEHTGFGWVYD